LKRIYLIIITAFLFSGCGVQDIKDHFYEDDAKNKLSKLCKREVNSNLVVCNNNNTPEPSRDLTIEEFREIAYSYLDGNHYKYKADEKNNDIYSYMRPDPDGIMRGDCEDFVIMIIQKMVMDGSIKKDSVKWIYGKAIGDYHAWSIITIEGKEYVFDTVSWFGMPLQEAYEKGDYREIATLFKY